MNAITPIAAAASRRAGFIPPLLSRGRRLAALKNRVLVGTHHKTGSVWMMKVFTAISRKLDLRMYHAAMNAPTPPNHDILVRDHSDFRPAEREGEFRGLHVIRDPRDVVVSGAHYHTHAKEPWLHEKRRGYGGLSYQEKINSYASEEDRLLFEMEETAYHNIVAMRDWDYTDPRFLNVRYEDLITDNSLVRFEQVFHHLGFREWSVGWCLVSAYRNSLFSGAVQSKHVRSGAGRQWPKHFTSVHKERFLALYGDVLAHLGYDDGSDPEWAAL